MSVAVAFALCAVTAALAVVAGVALLSWRKRRLARGPLALVGRAASVAQSLAPEGSVMVGGELWRARTESGRHVGRGEANVLVTGARGHLLVVAERGDKDVG
ncbi:MAG TPA: NfeD family protein [Pyrinomonadaceae bacterium]|nr:NfeD family protein [Pyrinomonadaceae bacterium]